MADAWRPRERYGEAFWRAHHEGWRQSDLNQREYCEAQGLSLKAFGNWRAKFKAELRVGDPKGNFAFPAGGRSIPDKTEVRRSRGSRIQADNLSGRMREISTLDAEILSEGPKNAFKDECSSFKALSFLTPNIC
jgi:hypothetical protein